MNLNAAWESRKSVRAELKKLFGNLPSELSLAHINPNLRWDKSEEEEAKVWKSWLSIWRRNWNIVLSFHFPFKT